MFSQADYGAKFFESILHLIDVGIHLVDQDGITIFYNDKMAEIDRLDRQHVIGKSVFHLYPSLTSDTSTLAQVLGSGQLIPSHIQTYVTLAGKRITTINSTYPLYEEGHIIGALEVAKDITSITHLYDQILDLKDQLYRQSSDGEYSPHRLYNEHSQHLQQGSTSHRTNRRQVRPWNSGTAKYHFSDLIGQSPLFLDALSLAKKAARSHSPVFICGPTGTGKELIAQSIHNAGIRRNEPFIAQNCAAVPAELMEGLMFGTVRGAFTGAIDRAGLFEQADGGTLFLDELNSLDPMLQAKLLRVLQDGCVRRVGATKEQQVNVRIIAAMNMEPKEALERGILRHDLYFRLHVVNVCLPPLRQREADIPLLIQHFIDQFNDSFGMKITSISADALRRFKHYDWPGNIRELRHAVESAYNMMELDDEFIEEHHLPAYLRQRIDSHAEHVLESYLGQSAHMPPNNAQMATCSTTHASIPSPTSEPESGPQKLTEMIREMEYNAIINALEQQQYNVSNAAQDLGITRQSLQYKMSRYGIVRKP
ncbi:sigma 54-interacting transcriptional regulator [Paenibacillus sp. 481]|nr:sigma 54-interacting transcriptional regulator [Paenibacillus sp. 481]